MKLLFNNIATLQSSLLAALLLLLPLSGRARLGEDHTQNERADLLADVTLENGAKVKFFEPDDGLIVIQTQSSPNGIDPLAEFTENYVGEKKDPVDFYKHITNATKEFGDVDLPQKLGDAYGRYKIKQPDLSTANWPAPNDLPIQETSPALNDESRFLLARTISDEQDDRNLCWNPPSPPSATWWKAYHCSFSKQIDFCKCRTGHTGDASYYQTTDNIFQKIYAYRGSVSHKLEYMRCVVFPFSDRPFHYCYWKQIGYDNVPQDKVSTILATSNYDLVVRSSILNASGDGYHFSMYDLAKSPMDCRTSCSGGCYKCRRDIG